MRIGKYLKIGAILASIAGVSALIISSVNLITAPIIANNKAEKERKGLANVFADATIGEAVEGPFNNYSTLVKYWPVVTSANENARIYSASDKNGYGAVSVLIGIYDDFTLGKMSILENTETYGQTLVNNYISVYWDAETAQEREDALKNVTCGATYGAKLIRDMVYQAVDHYKEGK